MIKTWSQWATLAVAIVSSGLALSAFAQQEKTQRKIGYDDTPLLPNSKYRVHDGTRPQPSIVTPGTASTQDAPGKAPSDAVVLFDGKDSSAWRGGSGGAATWKVEDGAFVASGGDILTKQEFGDCQLHVEFAAPTPPKGDDQGRGNSGIMLMGRYEFQVLDCYDNLTYPDGTVGAVYGQTPPMVNASRPPGQWQTVDILFTAPRFKGRDVETPAYVTILLNGVVVQNHTPIIGSVAFRAVAKYEPHGPKGPVLLQDHGNPVRYRNIWVRELEQFANR
jgi:3-keto-disaccharide hydrolase